MAVGRLNIVQHDTGILNIWKSAYAGTSCCDNRQSKCIPSISSLNTLMQRKNYILNCVFLFSLFNTCSCLTLVAAGFACWQSLSVWCSVVHPEHKGYNKWTHNLNQIRLHTADTRQFKNKIPWLAPVQTLQISLWHPVTTPAEDQLITQHTGRMKTWLQCKPND